MLTDLGKFLRKLRIDRNEVMKDMADQLGVTVSFLSAVENGKKRMPATWNRQICELYEVGASSQDGFAKAIALTESSIELSFENTNSEANSLAVAFARKFSDFDERQLEKLRSLLKGDA